MPRSRYAIPGSGSIHVSSEPYASRLQARGRRDSENHSQNTCKRKHDSNIPKNSGLDKEFRGRQQKLSLSKEAGKSRNRSNGSNKTTVKHPVAQVKFKEQEMASKKFSKTYHDAQHAREENTQS